MNQQHVTLSLPAYKFLIAELEATHAQLDIAGSPRTIDGVPLSVSQRATIAVGILVDLRNTVHVQNPAA